MKYIINALLLFVCSSILSGQVAKSNVTKGFGANGYDVVSYFDHVAKEGKSDFFAVHEGITYKFSSQGNLNKFKANPSKYVPQYGGWCAYAMAKTGKKVTIDPNTYEIRNDKLYLFYNKLFNNTFDSWKSEGPDSLVKLADKNWLKF